MKSKETLIFIVFFFLLIGCLGIYNKNASESFKPMPNCIVYEFKNYLQTEIQIELKPIAICTSIGEYYGK